MQIVKQWTKDDGTQVKLTLVLQGGFGEFSWRAFVDIKPKRKRKWTPEPDWKTVISRERLLALQRELCDQICAMEPR